MPSLTSIAAHYAGKKALAAIRRDRSNRFALLEPWHLPPPDNPDIELPDYAGKWITIHNRATTLHPKSEDIDGATGFPERVGNFIVTIPAIGHDMWYAEMEDMAAAWGWSVRRVRRLGDELFYNIALKTLEHGDLSPAERLALRSLAYALYRVLRAGGGIFHILAKWFLVGVILGTLAVTSCASPRIWWTDTTTIPPPIYEQIR